MKEVDFKKQAYDVFEMFDKQWALATAGTVEECNTMTIGWGTLGTIWGPPAKGRSIVTIFLRENRYTLEYIEKSSQFTVSFFPEKYKKALGLLGSVSGRDNPKKIEESGLTPEEVDGTITFEEADQVFVCKKLFSQRMEPEHIVPDIRETMYNGQPAHYMIIGEIERYIDRRD